MRPGGRSRLGVPLTLTLILIAARLAAVPPLTDPVNTAVPGSLRFSIPAVYVALAPVFTTWDGISMLSMRRLTGFLAGLLALYLAWRVWRAFSRSRRTRLLRELGVLLLSVSALAVYLVVGAVWHRPMLSLTGAPAGELVVDFHSHTNASHDVTGTWMAGFDAAANLRWHRRAGFDAAFITDHNVVSRESRVASEPGPHGPGESRVASREPRAAGGTVPCPGIEVSAWRAHVVLLGDTLPVDRRRYNRNVESLLQLLQTSESAYGALSVASLPEYRRNHWHRLDSLVQAGLDGFEIVNASPKANELSRADRDTVIGLARARNRLVLGVSDSHGWGATNMVWNLVPIASDTGPSAICNAILRQLRTGFRAVRVIERHRLRPDSWWPMALTPVGMVWETWRSMGWPLTLSWLLWLWVPWTVIRLRRRS